MVEPSYFSMSSLLILEGIDSEHCQGIADDREVARFSDFPEVVDRRPHRRLKGTVRESLLCAGTIRECASSPPVEKSRYRSVTLKGLVTGERFAD